MAPIIMKIGKKNIMSITNIKGNPNLTADSNCIISGSTGSGITTTSSSLVGAGSTGSYYHQTLPYFGGGISTQVTTDYSQQDVILRKVENGWILKMHNKEYVLIETAQVTKYLQLFEETK